MSKLEFHNNINMQYANEMWSIEQFKATRLEEYTGTEKKQTNKKTLLPKKRKFIAS